MENYRLRKTYRSAKKFTSRIAELKAVIYARQLMISEAHGVQKSLSEAQFSVHLAHTYVHAHLAKIQDALAKTQDAFAKAETLLPEETQPTFLEAQSTFHELQSTFAKYQARLQTTLSKTETVLFEEAKSVCLKAEDRLSLSEKLYHEFLEETAAGLGKELSTVQETLGEKEINIKPRFGIRRKIVFNDIRIKVHRNRPSFWFVDAENHILAEYRKPEQVLTIIEMLKAAVERGDSEFDFLSTVELRRIV